MSKKFTYYSNVSFDKSHKQALAQAMGTKKGILGVGYFVCETNTTLYSDVNCTQSRYNVKSNTYAIINNVHATTINGEKWFVLELNAAREIVYIKYSRYKTDTTGHYSFTNFSSPGKIGFTGTNNYMAKDVLNSSGVTGLYQLSENGNTINSKAVIEDYGTQANSNTNVNAKEEDAIASTVAAASNTSSSTTSTDDDDDPTNGRYAVEAANTLIWNAGSFISVNQEGTGPGNKLKDYKDKYINGVKYSNLRNIFGSPYQFLPSTDCRLNDSNGASIDDIFIRSNSSEAALERAGYEFSEKIISRMPLLFITPGNTSFMGGGTKKNQRTKLVTSIEEAAGGLGDANTSALKSLLKDYNGKLYTIMPAYSEYFSYVNPMCRAGAIFLDIANKTLNGIKIDRYHWGVNKGPNYELYEEEEDTLGEDEETEEEVEEAEGEEQDTDNTEPEEEEDDEYYDGDDGSIFEEPDESNSWLTDFQNAIYYRNSIAFYINSEASFQESFSNELTDSILSSTINGLSDKAREIQFLLGTARGAVGEAYDRIVNDSTISNIKESIDKIVNSVSKGNSIFATIANSVKTIVSGGRMIFPQIWANSNFNKSYNISIKLTTPSFDRFSWWLNIYVPLCHLAALVLPRSEYVNSYTTPFIIKAFYKGMFNIDMGIITEMSFNRGKEGSWTADGLPTVVDVTFTIQDLYSSMGMTSTGSMFKGFTLQNVAELDYLANICGININQPDIVKMVHLWAAFNFIDRVTDIIPNLKLAIGSSVINKITGLYNNLWGI